MHKRFNKEVIVILTGIIFAFVLPLNAQFENWVWSLNGPGNNHDHANAITFGNDGNLYAAGYVRNTSNKAEIFVANLNTSGDTNWTYAFQGSGSDHDRGDAIVYGDDDNIYVAGYADEGGTDRDFAVVSITSDGGENWVYFYNGTSNDEDAANAIVYGGDGNLYAAGYARNADDDFLVISLGTAGDTNWTYTYQGSGNGDDQANAIVYGADGNIYAVGYVGNADDDFLVISLSTAGDTNWTYAFQGSGNDHDHADAIVYGDDGNIYVAGYAEETGAGRDFTVISLTTSGVENWVYSYNGTTNNDDAANEIVYGTDGNIYVAGYVRNANDDFLVISLATAGDTNWTYTYQGSANGEDRAIAIAYGVDTRIYAAGYAREAENNYNFTVISLTNSGSENWVYSLNGAANNNDQANAIVYGADNNTYVAGYIKNANDDFCVIALNTGAPVIESTTVWTDTTFTGPFPVYTKVTDGGGVDSVLLYYKRPEEPSWLSIEMTAIGSDWYSADIPQTSIIDDTVKYYIYATDTDQPAHVASDPYGAPTNYYSFLVYSTGVEENGVMTSFFSFGLQSNPAKGHAIFNLTLAQDACIDLKIYDISGRLVTTIVSGNKAAGSYEIPWSQDVNAGVYFYHLESPRQTESGKFVLVR